MELIVETIRQLIFPNQNHARFPRGFLALWVLHSTSHKRLELIFASRSANISFDLALTLSRDVI